mmetsp:Transcript_25476/g.75032  ORF Transcript_25476/g.75032 Transcript_25476/m.75032 type:complete len:138 (-) Transcript_25476:23-436(-)
MAGKSWGSRGGRRAVGEQYYVDRMCEVFLPLPSPPPTHHLGPTFRVRRLENLRLEDGVSNEAGGGAESLCGVVVSIGMQKNYPRTGGRDGTMKRYLSRPLSATFHKWHVLKETTNLGHRPLSVPIATEWCGIIDSLT